MCCLYLAFQNPISPPINSGITFHDRSRGCVQFSGFQIPGQQSHSSDRRMRLPGKLKRLFNTQTLGSSLKHSPRPVRARESDKNRGVPGVTTIQFSNRGKIARFFFGLNLGTGGALEPSRALFFSAQRTTVVLRRGGTPCRRTCCAVPAAARACSLNETLVSGQRLARH